MVRRERKASFERETTERKLIHRTAQFPGDETIVWEEQELPQPRWCLFNGKDFSYVSDRKGGAAASAGADGAALIKEAWGRSWWLYKGEIYSTAEDDLQPDEVAALVDEQTNKKRLKIARAKTVAAMAKNLDRAGKRQPIPREVKVSVWQRDEGRCIQCGSAENLEFDHVIPHSRGGADTERNLQLLCADCNREKGASL